jgi:hypothetical protein
MVGINPVIANGPKKPLVVQYALVTWANAPDEPTRQIRPINAAAIPVFFITNLLLTVIIYAPIAQPR